MLEFILISLTALRVLFRSRSGNAVEILALRQQLVVLKRKQPRPQLNPLDRLFWIAYCSKTHLNGKAFVLTPLRDRLLGRFRSVGRA